MLVYLIALCMSVNCVYILDTLALSMSIIQEIGNINCTMIVSPIEAAKNTVIMKDSN